MPAFKYRPDDAECGAGADRMSIDFSDQDLVSRVRHGDTAAFGDLYAHHSAAAHRAARRIVRDPHIAEDVVSESFARVFKALQGGNGPTGDLLPYLLVTMRNVAASWGRESVKWTPVGDDAAFQPRDARDLAAGADELPVDRLNMSLTSSAFETLPRRWRTVLWYLEVEGESASEVGQRLGLSDVAVRQLARRAREGLREAYLAAYLGGTPTVGAHVASADLVAMARGKLSLRRRAAVEKHLDTCPTCSGLLFEAAEENSTLRALVLPFYMAIAFALVKWSQTLGARVPKLPGKHLVHAPAVQAGMAAVSIVAVVSGALAVTPQFGGGGPADRAGAGQPSGAGRASVSGVVTPPPASSPGTSSRSVSVTPTTPRPTTTSTASTTPPTSTAAPTTSASTAVSSSTSALPIPTVVVSGEPTPTFRTALPTVIFPTMPTVPLSSTTPTTVVPTTVVPTTVPPTTAPTTTASTTAPTTAPATSAPTTTPTTTTPTTTTAPTTDPTTTAPPTTRPLPDLSIAGVPVLIYPAGRQFPNDTDFRITVSNHSAQALRSVVTFALPDDVELSADLDHVSCLTSGTTVTCRHHVSGYWENVPANGSVTYDVLLDHRAEPGQVQTMPLPTVDTDPDQ